MRQPFKLITGGVCILFFAAAVLAQTDVRPPESSFEVTLSIISGSNETGKTDLPSSFAPIARQLRANFGLTNLHLADTYVGRIGNGGNIQYKSLANIDAASTSATPSFLDWTIAGLRNAAGSNSVFIQSFRFGARVPVAIGAGSPIQYEQIGLNVDRITAVENSPVLIGTIALPKADGGRVFLVLNVSPVTN
jgi:hypothetical protein